MPNRQKQKFNHGQTVYVYWREAIYAAEYRGYDNFERDESHIVFIPAANGEENVSSEEVFGSLQRAKQAYPNATDHVRGI